ncbi:MAG: hypothetical protein ACKN9T_16395, partial [Candidatus Methylumidiphilus sp.]
MPATQPTPSPTRPASPALSRAVAPGLVGAAATTGAATAAVLFGLHEAEAWLDWPFWLQASVAAAAVSMAALGLFGVAVRRLLAEER